MNGPRAFWILAAALLFGCQGQRPAYDPFGRTTIPPPATGAVAAPGYGAPLTTAPPAVSVPAAPQFAPAPINVQVPATPAAAPGLSPAPAGTPAGTAPTLQPGVRVPNPSPPWSGSVQRESHPAGSTATATTVPIAPLQRSPRLQPASPFETGIVATITPATTPSATPLVATVAAPASLPAVAAAPTPIAQPASQVVVIDNGSRGEAVIRVEDASRLTPMRPTPLAQAPASAAMPSTGTWTSGDPPKTLTPVTGPTTVTLASHNENSILVPSGSSKSAIVPTAVTSPAASPEYESRYGRAPDYSRLKGKLEYSATRKQWKLRYIPVDAAGQTDQYGGSVLLSGLSDMSQYHDGDFAAVEGTLGQRADDAKDFAGSYQVRQIQRVQ